MSTSASLGAGELNPNVNILDIFNTHVLPETHDANVNARPIVKADAIKLICIFRTHLQAPFLLSILPHVIRHLSSKYVVVQTYAALCVERFLTVKVRLMGEKVWIAHISPSNPPSPPMRQGAPYG